MQSPAAAQIRPLLAYGGGTTMILPEGDWSIHQPSGVTPTNRARRTPGNRGLVLSDSTRSRGYFFRSACLFGFAASSVFLAGDFSGILDSKSDDAILDSALSGPCPGEAGSLFVASGSSAGSARRTSCMMVSFGAVC
jgi:hypothetical protein